MGVFDRKEKTSDEISPPSSAHNGPHGPGDVQEGYLAENVDFLQRRLNNRQIQLIAIGGSIGTALFVSIGNGLYHAGAGGLLLGYLFQSLALAMVNNCVAEMSTAHPVSGGYIRLAGKWVDDALGFMVGWNFL
jgi:yeast amino acid transporter